VEEKWWVIWKLWTQILEHTFRPSPFRINLASSLSSIIPFIPHTPFLSPRPLKTIGPSEGFKSRSAFSVFLTQEFQISWHILRTYPSSMQVIFHKRRIEKLTVQAPHSRWVIYFQTSHDVLSCQPAIRNAGRFGIYRSCQAVPGLEYQLSVSNISRIFWIGTGTWSLR
jgi:hypothetical protein